MESSPYTAVTLDIFETLWQQGYRNAGVVLQSYLQRSEDDARAMNALGARVRLVKGAYKEPRDASPIRRKADVDAAFVAHDEAAARPRAPIRRSRRTIPAMIDATRSVRDGAAASTASLRVPDAVRHPPRPAGSRCTARATVSASTFRSAVNGFRTSCAGSANARPMSVS